MRETENKINDDIRVLIMLSKVQEFADEIALATEYMADITNPTIRELKVYCKALKRFHRDLKPIIKKIKGEK